jgi:putative membrane protein
MNNPSFDDSQQTGGRSISGKQIVIGVLVVVAVIFAVVNHESVETNFLFFTVRTPHWIGLVINFALGAAVGWFLCSRRNSRRQADA